MAPTSCCARAPVAPGLPERDQHRAGQLDILQTSFATFERNGRDQLARILDPGGFDPASDITAITVNWWPHGYATNLIRCLIRTGQRVQSPT
jgi:spermidine dehydrogenase